MLSVHALFEDSLGKTALWLEEIMAETGWDDPKRAYSTLRAVLHTLRDRLTPDEAVDLSIHLPLLVRGLYFEAWRPDQRPEAYGHKDDFLERVNRRYARNQGPELETAVRAVLNVLARHLPPKEVDQIKRQLPRDLRALWPSPDGS